MRRDTVGSAGSNKRVSTRIFAPSLTQYVSDTSKRHAVKILDAKTGAHRFPMLPTISTKLWGKVQKFDIMRLLLSTSTGSKHVKKQWLDELDYFHAIETDGMMYTEIIKKFREDRDKIHVARSTLEAIIMPTTKCLINLRRSFAISQKIIRGNLHSRIIRQKSRRTQKHSSISSMTPIRFKPITPNTVSKTFWT